MMTIHWCGTGANALPGLRRLLAASPCDVIVWARSPALAAKGLGDQISNLRPFDADMLAMDVQAGDVLVSMLPPDMHLSMATIATNKGAHLVCPGTLTPEIQALHARALLARACLVMETGFSPGIDHLLGRHLVDAYSLDPECHPANTLTFTSRAGVLPATKRPFDAGLGTQAERLLRALSAPARGVRAFQDWRVNLPWDAAEQIEIGFDTPEPFDTLPRGDAVPLLDVSGCDPTWHIAHLERALLRPPGWTAAWGPVLSQLDALKQVTPSPPETALTATRGDRAVLAVSLSAHRDETLVWSRTAVMDAIDTQSGNALARLVSLHVALVAERLAQGAWDSAGVATSVSDSDTIMRWLAVIARETRYFNVTR